MNAVSYRLALTLIQLGRILSVEDLLGRHTNQQVTNLFKELLEEMGFDQISFYAVRENVIIQKSFSRTIVAESKVNLNSPFFVNLMYLIQDKECEKTSTGYKISKIPVEDVGDDFAILLPTQIWNARLVIGADDTTCARDVSDHVVSIELLAHLVENVLINRIWYDNATIDQLTGVRNRASYDSQSINIKDGFMLVIDIDHFKKVNDEYGHQAGDFVLQTIANVLKHSFRIEDFVARYGGEEFVVILQCEKKDLKHLVGRLLENIRNSPIELKCGTILKKTVSVGISRIDSDCKQAFKRADAALYKAKNNGRDQAVYDI